MKQVTPVQKNVVVENSDKKNTFTKFLANFTTLRKADHGFYFWDDRRVDYVVLKSAAIAKGLTHIPSQEELDELI